MEEQERDECPEMAAKIAKIDKMKEKQEMQEDNAENMVLYAAGLVKARPKKGGGKKNAINIKELTNPTPRVNRIVIEDDKNAWSTSGYFIRDGPYLYLLDIDHLQNLNQYEGFNHGRENLYSTIPCRHIAEKMSLKHDKETSMHMKEEDMEYDQDEITSVLNAFVLPDDEEDAEIMRTWKKENMIQIKRPVHPNMDQ